MFCPNCGSKIDDDAVFCEECGTKITKNQVEDITEYSSAPNTESSRQISSKLVRNKIKKKPIIFAAVAVVCLTLIATVVVNALNGNIANTFAKITKSDAEYMQWVSKRDKDALLNIVDAFATNGNVDGKYIENIEFSLTNEGKDILYEMGAGEEEISWLNSGKVSLSINNNTKDNASEISAKASLNEKDIVDGSVIIDNGDSKVYLTVPEYLSDTVDISEGLFGQSSYFAGSYYPTEMLSQFIKVPMLARVGTTTYGEYMSTQAYINLIMKSENGRKLLSDYLDVVFDNIDNVEKTDSSIKASGVSQDCTKYSAKIDYDTLIKCANALINMAKNDKELKEFIYDYLKTTEKSYETIKEKYGADIEFDADKTLDDFYDWLDELQEEVNDYKESEFNYHIVYNIFVNGNGRIIGRDVTYAETNSYSEKTEGYEIKLYTTIEKSEFGIDLKVEEVDYINNSTDLLLRIKGDGDVSGSKYTGDASLYIGHEDEKYCTLEFENLDISKFARGNLNGRISLIPKDDMYDDMDGVPEGVYISANLEGSLTGADIKLTVKKGSDDLAILKIEYSVGKNSSIKIPTDAIDSNDVDENVLDLDKVIKRLTEAGVPDDLAEDFADEIGPRGTKITE